MIRRFSVIALISASTMLASLAASGCGGSVADKPAETAATSQAITTTSEHGPVKALATALGSVSLSASQRTDVQKLFADADARHATAKEQGKAGRADLLNALAAQVEQGRVDRTALAPKEQALATNWQTSREADRAAIEKLHDLLDAGQRAALVDALRLGKGDGGPVGDEDGGGHRGRGKHGHPGRERLAKLADELKLSDDQKAKIGDAIRAEHGKDQAHHAPHAKPDAMFEAFKSDHFKMDEVAPATDAHPRAEHAIRLAEIAVPLLTPDQRTTLAAKIRARAQEKE